MDYQITEKSDNLYVVTKLKEQKVYTVDLRRMKCTCLGFVNWKKCKHIPMVQGFKLATEKKPLTASDKVKTELAFHSVEELDFGLKCVDKIQGFLPEGVILDIETTGLDPEEDEIITFGYIRENSVIIFQRTERETSSFYQAIKEELKTIPQPIFAYYAEFEKGFLEKFGFRGMFIDILEPWKTSANELGIKAPKLDELVPGPEKYMGERRTTGGDIINMWYQYLDSGGIDVLKLIIRHNQIDILQEFAAVLMTSLIR
jgi:hypothetical protein